MTAWTTQSPDGLNTLTVWLDPDGSLHYDAVRRGEVLVRNGRLGLVREDGSFAEGLDVVGVGEAVLIEAPYTIPHGKRRSGVLEARQRVLSFMTDGGKRLDLVVCAAIEGVAFRYRFPEDNPAPHYVVDEVTSFPLPEEGNAWLQPTQVPDYSAPAYENLYLNAVGTDHQDEAPGYNMPALFKTPHAWLLVAESDLDAGYAGCRLDNRSTGSTYRISLPEAGEGAGVGEVAPSQGLPWTLPWRVIVLADTAPGIATSDLVNALAHQAPGDFSWVRPGRASWSWWSEHESPQNIERLRRYVDLAAQFGWEYSLVDANWSVHPDAAVAELVTYAAARGVGLFLWYNSGGPHNTLTEQPRDRMVDARIRRAEMDRLVEWGVAGLKVDFFHSEKQSSIELYLDIARDAAERRLMVNFHGCTVPRGWARSFPNIVTMEAVAGAEQYAFRGDYPAAAPRHNTILPFTRNVVGPMDYTPVTFSDQRYPHRTTNAHELALSVVFESGLQHFADAEDSYRWAPEPVRALLAAVPAAWDETVVLDGTPGDYVVVARRRGREWFAAGISGRDEPLHLLVGLHMLEGCAVAHAIHDGATPREFSWETYDVTANDIHEVTLASRGGFVVWLTPQ